MSHNGGKLGVTPFLAIQSSLHLLVLQLIPLTSVTPKMHSVPFVIHLHYSYAQSQG